jgi:excinuclease ABC subunit C
MDISEKIRTLPTGAGCYLYKNAEGEVIYVGKAKNLRSRVRSYFLAANQGECEDGFADARGGGPRVHHGGQ